MIEERMYPLHSDSRRKGFKPLPWRVVEQWREQIEKNHGQTLERLAERGGLAHEELCFAANEWRLGALLDGLSKKWQERCDAWMREQERVSDG